jgi:hypothetical protein
MDKIASVSEAAKTLLKKSSTILGLIFAVDMLIFLELMKAMSKFASSLVRAIAMFDELFAQLGLLFIVVSVVSRSRGFLGGK